MDESQALVKSITQSCFPAQIQRGIDRAEFLEFFSALTGAFVDTYAEIQSIKTTVSAPRNDTDAHYNRLSTQLAQSHARFTDVNTRLDNIETKLSRLYTLVERLVTQPRSNAQAEPEVTAAIPIPYTDLPGDIPKVAAKVEPPKTLQQPPVFKKISVAIAACGLNDAKKQEILKSIGDQAGIVFFEPNGIIMPDHKPYDFIYVIKNGLNLTWYNCAKRMIPQKKMREVMDVALVVSEIKKLIPSPSRNS